MEEILPGESCKSICATSKDLKWKHLKLLRGLHKPYLT